MKNDMIINAFNTIQPDQEAKKRVWEKARQKQTERRWGLKLALSLAAIAAVLCLTILGGPLFPAPNGGNAFTLKAYAMAATEDGSVRLSQVAITDDRPEDWGGYIDFASNTMYVGLGFKCDGEDLQRVELSTATGFFARQYIGDIADSMEGLSFDHVGSQNSGYRLFMVGDDLERAGNTLVLDRESLDDQLFFWGLSYGEDEAGFEEDLADFAPPFPKELRFQARITWADGKTAERDIIIDLSAQGEISFKLSPEQEAAQQAEQRQKQAAHHQLLARIPLDECEVAAETLSYGDAYQYRTADESSTAILPISEEAMSRLPFDPEGRFKLSSYLPGDGRDGHIVTLVRNNDGTFTGMTYIVPGELIGQYYEEEALTSVVYIYPQTIPSP